MNELNDIELGTNKLKELKELKEIKEQEQEQEELQQQEQQEKEEENKKEEKEEENNYISFLYLLWEEIITTDDMPNLVEYLCPYNSGSSDEILSPYIYIWMIIIITLRGVSQVYLCAHPIAAIIICIGRN